MDSKKVMNEITDNNEMFFLYCLRHPLFALGAQCHVAFPYCIAIMLSEMGVSYCSKLPWALQCPISCSNRDRCLIIQVASSTDMIQSTNTEDSSVPVTWRPHSPVADPVFHRQCPARHDTHIASNALVSQSLTVSQRSCRAR